MLHFFFKTCLKKKKRHLVFAYSIFDPFKSSYKSFNFWMD